MSLIALFLLLQAAPEQPSARWVVDVPVGLRSVRPPGQRGVDFQWMLGLRVGQQTESHWLFQNGISGFDVSLGLADMTRDGTDKVYVERSALAVEPRVYTGWQLKARAVDLAFVASVGAVLGGGQSTRVVYGDSASALFGIGGLRAGIGAQAVFGHFLLRIDTGVGARVAPIQGETFSTVSLGWKF
jgi:hypothetical protein